MSTVGTIVGTIAVVEGIWMLAELADRQRAYAEARHYCDLVGKPLLNIGCPSTRPLAYPCGDVCLEVAPGRLRFCRSAHPVLGDVANLSRFADKVFGAVTCFHVLEHLPTVRLAQAAIAEMVRVADQLLVCSPSRFNPIAWLHPDHHLWIESVGGGIYRIEQRLRGQDAGEVGYPLLQKGWAGFEATMRSLTTGTSLGEAYAGERAIVEGA